MQSNFIYFFNATCPPNDKLDNYERLKQENEECTKI